ncbi:MAG: HAMP domain-containing protein [Anaerolineales bacterium]|nr:MAG: HAMP domain-containing protein [Anaerolineales bacterium]
MFANIRGRLAWKLFLSYLIVVVAGAVVLASTAELAIPNSFQRHLATMGSMMNQMRGESSTGLGLNADLFTNFRLAVQEALLLAALASILVAVIVSLLFSRRIVAPVKQMMAISQRIANGHYDERVNIPGRLQPAEMDELANLAVAFNQMAAQLERTESMRRELIGDVAHELRTPLTTIKASLEGLIDGVLPAQVETYQQVHREAERMQRLVQDLQELSQVEAGVYPMQFRNVQITDLVEAARARLERQFIEKGVDLIVDIPADLPLIDADENRIGQVLINLLGNALQYTESPGTVRVSAARMGHEVVVSVHDSGLGIPVEHLAHIFTRFYRVDKSRARASGGTGIGLTIAKHIVEAHNGRIWAESPGAGQGSRFSFSLPFLPE